MLTLCQELNVGGASFVGPAMVAKQSRHVGAENDAMDFHLSFAMTQLMAQRIASRFNRRVRGRLNDIHPNGRAIRVWDISFLPCSVYTFVDGGLLRGVLAEKKLVGRYTKFNSNNGYVRGTVVGPTVAAPATTVRGGLHEADADPPAVVALGVLEECDEEDSDSDGASCAMSGSDDEDVLDEEAAEVTSSPYPDGGDDDDDGSAIFSFDPTPECYSQAFSHFSYRNSSRKMLVCDLQGVQSRSSAGDEERAGVFELTDPVIHYRSKSGRRQVYGRTDLGKKGMHKFFKTHQCNDVCRLLGLSL